MFKVIRCLFDFTGEEFQTLERDGFETEQEAEAFAVECERCLPAYYDDRFIVKEDE